MALRLRFPLRRWLAGYLRSEAGLEALFKAVYHQALLDLQPFVKNGKILSAWWSAPLAARAKALSAALFLDDALPVVPNVVSRLLSTIPSHDEAEEMLLMTHFASWPWREDLPRICFRCGREKAKGKGFKWRQVLTPPAALADAYQWRYEHLPENHVPLCRACALFAYPEDARHLWGRAVWGVRFDAWERIHQTFLRGELPHWDREASPLWPPSFSDGADWASGAGTLLIRYPRPYAVKRLAPHREAARQLLSRFPLARRRWGTSFLVKVASHRRGNSFALFRH